jgi:hypothetical protein
VILKLGKSFTPDTAEDGCGQRFDKEIEVALEDTKGLVQFWSNGKLIYCDVS